MTNENNSEKKDKYEKIRKLPHHVSERHVQMSNHDRAAQFAPFAALSGFDDEIEDATEKAIKDNQ